MPLVLVEGAVIQCSHGGQCKLGGGSQSLTVGGHGVLVQGAEAGFRFGAPDSPVAGMTTPCTAQTPTTPPKFQACVTAPTLPPGLATKLTVGGTPALLATANGTTVSGAGPGTWTITDAGQQLLEAI
ncbi:hypothetical protein ACPC54_39860 [Kitasatospora sp. NPDC094028]